MRLAIKRHFAISSPRPRIAADARISAAAALYLYLLSGAGTAGSINRETGAANAATAAITASLQPDAYTIDATTYYAETAGDFTLDIEIAR